MGNVVAAKRPGALADVIAAGMELAYNRKQEFLERLNPYERLEMVITTMRTSVRFANQAAKSKTKQSRESTRIRGNIISARK